MKDDRDLIEGFRIMRDHGIERAWIQVGEATYLVRDTGADFPMKLAVVAPTTRGTDPVWFHVYAEASDLPLEKRAGTSGSADWARERVEKIVDGRDRPSAIG